MSRRTPLILLTALVLAPAPVLALLGERALDELNRGREELEVDRARARLAEDLREHFARLPAPGAEARRWLPLDPIEPDDPGAVEFGPAPRWFSDPRRGQALRLADQDQSAPSLDRLALALEDEDPSVRMGAWLDTAQLLHRRGRSADSAVAARRAEQIPIDQPSLDRWRRARLAALRGPEGDPTLENWLSEIETRSTDLAELALIADALRHAPTAGPDPELTRRLEQRSRWPERRRRLKARCADSAARWLALCETGRDSLLAERAADGHWWIASAPELTRWLEEWRGEDPGVRLRAIEPASGPGSDPPPSSPRGSAPEPAPGPAPRPEEARSTGSATLGPLPGGVELLGDRAPTQLMRSDASEQRLSPLRLALRAGLCAYVLLGLGACWAAARAQRQARRVAQLRGDLIAEVTHELRTPLTVIRLYAETLQGDRLPAPARQEYLNKVQEESERLALLIDRVAEAARGDGARPGSRQDLDPETCLDPVVEALQAHAQGRRPLRVDRAGAGAAGVVGTEEGATGSEAAGAETHGLGAVSIEAAAEGTAGSGEAAGGHGAPSTPSPLVRADREELRRVLEILVDNALRYTPEGSPLELSTELRGEQWRFELRDHGPGIDPGERQRVFERWVRGRASTAAGTRGAGMGLWLARNTARELGGTMELSFPPDGGTLACLSLPLHTPPGGTPERHGATLDGAGRGAGQGREQGREP